jgi:single-stranded-DNA-specific exonuclease
VARGIVDADDAQRFLAPDLDRDWGDPALVPGMTEVADALEAAVRARRRILVFGDFDVDGISATACMARGLAALGADVGCLIPHRMDEGYGLTPGALERIYARAPETLVTVDCGISAHEEVAQLLAHGIEVLVTDHHEPSGSVPHGIPLTDPKLDPYSPFAGLAGAGVALKLMALLGARFGRPLLWRDLVDLATLGTVADVMPLTGENRSLVAEGLTLLGRTPRPGAAAALALSKRRGTELSTIDLSYGLIPRLNAAGRMGDPTVALDLLLSDEASQASDIAATLDALNTERRKVEAALLAEALAQAADGYHGQKVLVVAGEGWHEGVRGIVASRLVARYGVPVIVFTLTDGQARGSGRSIGTVNLFKAVERCGDLTLRFGGHAGAVGVTVAQERLDAFKERMEAVMAAEPDEGFHPPLPLDAQLALCELDREAVGQLALLGPYGHANREPLYVSCGVFLVNARAVGADKAHLSFSVMDDACTVSAIWFRCPCIEHILSLASCGKAVDVVYRPQVDEWGGTPRVKLMVEKVFESPDADDREGADGTDEGQGEGGGAACGPEGGSDGEDADDGAGADEGDADDAPGPAPEGDDIQGLASQVAGRPVRLHPAQAEALEALRAGESVLVVMATGRGKSLVFQAHAAYLARSKKAASVFVYPLRALIADQSAHLVGRLSRLGVKACAVTGENTADEKDELFQGLYEGSIDVVLTTPEFLGLHAWRFASSARIGLVVFDEAHHIQTERTAGRPAYRDLGALRAHFPQVQCLALTATSDARTAAAVKDALGIGRVIVDDTRRENLHVNDLRNRCDRDRLLAEVVAKAAKAVIYANSRMQTVVLARLLRKRDPRRAEEVVFYHAGLGRAARKALEDAFRAGEARVLVSTSAFGEGIDIPDISDVVLYSLPFSAAAFNQMSGRAGRDGADATVHLLYTHDDAHLNRRLLAPLSPGREEMVTLYRALGDLASGHDAAPGKGAPLVVSAQGLADACRHRDPQCPLDGRGALNALAILEELGLLEQAPLDPLGSLDDDEAPRTVALVADRRVELSASSRYLEGREELALFEDFRQWALAAESDELRDQIRGPLTPLGGRQADVHG